MKIERFACGLYSEDSSEFLLIDTEYLTESTPGSFKEDGE
jgi:hypothetical protein